MILETQWIEAHGAQRMAQAAKQENRACKVGGSGFGEATRQRSKSAAIARSKRPRTLGERMAPTARRVIAGKGYSMDEVRGSSRTADIVAVRRQVALALRENGFSLKDIGHYLGRHHSSVLSIMRVKQ